MKLKYASETGEIIEVIPHTFKPLTYNDIVNNPSQHGNTYNIEIFATPGNLLINGKKNKENKNIKCSIPIHFHNPPSIFAAQIN